MLAWLGLSFIVLLAIRVPVAYCMGAAAVLALTFGGSSYPLEIVPQRIFVTIDSFPLVAIPFFVLAGELMEHGGISARLIRLATAFIGHWRGGLAQVNVVATMIFSGVSGSAAADASAIGGIMVPAMKRRGYPATFCAVLQACAASTGPIIPPSIIMIIYASITGISVAALFLAGFIPGLLIGVGLMVLNHYYATRHGWGGEARATSAELRASAADAVWALVAPIIILGGIVLGIFTATEAGAVAVVYTLLVGLFVYREIRFADLPAILLRSAKTTGAVVVIIAMSGIFGWLLAIEQAPQRLTDFIGAVTQSAAMVMLLTLIMLLVVGCFVDVTAAAIILIPVLFPLGRSFGFDDTHFALVMCVALTYGLVTPPVGLLLFLTSKIAEARIRDMLPILWPYLGVLTAVLLLIAYWPGLVMFVPRLFL